MKKVLLSIEEACIELSIGRTKLYEELANNKIKAVKIGRRTLVSAQSIRDYVHNLQPYCVDGE